MTLFTLKERNTIVLGITIVTGLFLAYALKDIVNSIFGALIFYTIFRRLHLYLVIKRKIKAWLSATVIIILSFFSIVLPFFLLITMVVNKISSVSKNTEDLESIFSAINLFAAERLNQPNLIEDILGKVREGAMSIFSSVLGSTFHILLLLSIMYFILYFMFADYRRFEDMLLKYAPFSHRHSMKFARELRDITYSNVLGQGFIALIQGGLLALGFLLFGISDPIFWGIITLFLAFLPVVGAPFVFVPAGIIELSSGNNFAGIGILIWGFALVTNIDNVLRLFIAKWVGDIHPIITIIGVVIGIPFFGIVGLVFGPLLISFFILLVNIYQVNRKTLIENADKETVP